GFALRSEAPPVEVFAGDAPPIGDALRGAELPVGRVVVGPRIGLVVPGTVDHVGTQRDVAHLLHAAGDPDLDAVRGDEPGDEVVGLLRRPALRVDGRARGRVGQPVVPRAQPRVSGHVRTLLAGLGDTAPDGLVDEAGVDPRPLDDLDDRVAQRVGRFQSGERAVALADRGANS